VIEHLRLAYKSLEKLIPEQELFPQWLKPHSNNAFIAALKRCATQKQLPNPVVQQLLIQKQKILRELCVLCG
jgi:hypothetical protein